MRIATVDDVAEEVVMLQMVLPFLTAHRNRPALPADQDAAAVTKSINAFAADHQCATSRVQLTIAGSRCFRFPGLRQAGLITDAVLSADRAISSRSRPPSSGTLTRHTEHQVAHGLRTTGDDGHGTTDLPRQRDEKWHTGERPSGRT
jgi:hypothetical protein